MSEHGGDYEEEMQRRARRSNGPEPDPSDLTRIVVDQATSVAKEYTDLTIAVVEERMRGMDVATRLLSDEVNRVPSKLTQAVENIEKVQDGRFDAIAQQFRERDIRAERESRDNKIAVDAAFASAKEIAANEREATGTAIEKSEKATAETIKTNQELSKATTDGLTKGLDEVKLALSRLESSKQNATDSRNENRANTGAVVGYIVGGVGALGVVITILIAVINSQPA